LAIEIKRSLTPTPAKGFYQACTDLKPDEQYIINPGSERFPIREGLIAIHPNDLANQLWQNNTQ